MEHAVLKFLCNYNRRLGKRNKQFIQKAQKIAGAKDSFFVHALNLWNEEDELLKCQLAVEINSWIEELAVDIGSHRRGLLSMILFKLSYCGLSETVLDEAWPLYFIRCKISGIGKIKDIAINFLIQNIENERNGGIFLLSKKIKIATHAETISKILDRLIEKIKGDNESYLALVDGAYWEELAEIIRNAEEHVPSLLIDMISHIQESRAIFVPVFHHNHMEYIRSALSDLFLSCSLDFVDPCSDVKINDKFGLLLVSYIKYRAHASNVQMLMPTWLKFSKPQIEKKSQVLDRTNACAPGSHFFWFCSFVLGIRSLLEKHKNLSNANALFEVVRVGVFSGAFNGLYAIKYINSNMPPDTDATILVKNEVREFLEKGMLLDAVMEYTYYLSCLHEPYGISEKRRSWYKKNIQYIFSNYDEFLYMLRRVFVGILRKGNNGDKILLDDFEARQEQILRRSENSHVTKYIEINHGYSEDCVELSESRHEWLCFENKVWIQTELDNPERLVELSEKDAVDHLGRYLSKGAMGSMIEPRYVLNSLCNYAQFKEHDLHHRNPVWIDDVQWTKIRKGKVRLLVRSIREDLVFHAYKRKDYHPGMFD